MSILSKLAVAGVILFGSVTMANAHGDSGVHFDLGIRLPGVNHYEYCNVYDPYNNCYEYYREYPHYYRVQPQYNREWYRNDHQIIIRRHHH